ncbi:GSCOCG00011998001-RA-CDS [Cotesia congregata]|nr:GSCOCG00011998001-RA-CDS [Cotesia congregata]
MHYLNSDSITLSELDRASMLLKEYVKLFEEFFGTEKMTSNIHSLTHLARCVMNWGPSWVHNAFIFEAWNRNIIESLSSPNAREDQIATRFLMQRFLNTSAFDKSIASETRDYIVKKLKVVDETVEIGFADKFVLEGKPTIRSLTEGLIAQNFSHACYGFDTQFIHEVDKNHTNFIQETSRIRPAIKITTIGATYAIKLANCWETD